MTQRRRIAGRAHDRALERRLEGDVTCRQVVDDDALRVERRRRDAGEDARGGRRLAALQPGHGVAAGHLLAREVEEHAGDRRGAGGERGIEGHERCARRGQVARALEHLLHEAGAEALDEVLDEDPAVVAALLVPGRAAGGAVAVERDARRVEEREPVGGIFRQPETRPLGRGLGQPRLASRPDGELREVVELVRDRMDARRELGIEHDPARALRRCRVVRRREAEHRIHQVLDEDVDPAVAVVDRRRIAERGEPRVGLLREHEEVARRLLCEGVRSRRIAVGVVERRRVVDREVRARHRLVEIGEVARSRG